MLAYSDDIDMNRRIKRKATAGLVQSNASLMT